MDGELAEGEENITVVCQNGSYSCFFQQFRKDQVYLWFLGLFAILTAIVNILVIIILLYHVKLKLRSRHVLFVNFCITEIINATWEYWKDSREFSTNTLDSNPALLVPLVILQGASTLTVIMMVCLLPPLLFKEKNHL